MNNNENTKKETMADIIKKELIHHQNDLEKLKSDEKYRSLNNIIHGVVSSVDKHHLLKNF